MSDDKLSHAAASYREHGTPAAHCANCTMFRDRERQRCTLVVDPIEWYGYCKYHDPKRTRS
jgi:hypothetical protein